MINLNKVKNESIQLHFFIIDGDTSFSSKLSRTLNNDPNYEIDTFEDLGNFLSKYHPINTTKKRKDKTHVLIIDSNQFEKKEDFEIIHKIKKNNKNVEIILLMDKENELFITDAEALKSGVYATITKNDNILYRIENSARGIKSLKLFMKKRRTIKYTLIAFFAFIIIVMVLYFLLRNIS